MGRFVARPTYRGYAANRRQAVSLCPVRPYIYLTQDLHLAPKQGERLGRTRYVMLTAKKPRFRFWSM